MENNFETLTIRPIAYMHSAFPTKFGIPRQGDVVKEIKGTIVFEKEFRKEGILRGLEDFSHIWLIWGFSATEGDWSPLVRPPKLGGNEKKGVFASRSPNRPNPLGLSAVRIVEIRNDKQNGLVIDVSGTDLMDMTPIYDIKPYIPYADSIKDAKTGFAIAPNAFLETVIPEQWASMLSEEDLKIIAKILADDPRPGYQHDPTREYGFFYQNFNIRFKVEDERVAIVTEIEKIVPNKKGFIKADY